MKLTEKKLRSIIQEEISEMGSSKHGPTGMIETMDGKRVYVEREGKGIARVTLDGQHFITDPDGLRTLYKKAEELVR